MEVVGNSDVVLSIGAYDSIKVNCLMSVWNLIGECAKRNIRVRLHVTGGANICINRINGVRQAQLDGSKYVFFVDSDMVFDPKTLLRLMEHDLDIVSGVYFGKSSPFVPIAATFKDPEDPSAGYNHFLDIHEDGRLVEVDGVGGGCLLVKTVVFDYLEKPWFTFGANPGKDEPIGEDYWFCRIAKEKGYKVWLDTGCLCGHLGEKTYTINDHIWAMEMLKRKRESPTSTEGGIILAPR